MKTVTFLILSLLSSAARAEPGTSADYSITTQSLDSGGTRTASTSYTIDGSAGGIAGTSTVSSPDGTVLNGYIAQLYNVTGLALNAAPATVNAGGATSQLTGCAVMDDNSVTLLAGTDISWSLVSGPVASISTSGVLTTGTEQVDSAAVVAGAWLGIAATTTLYVLNGNYGIYGGAGIPDTWQVQYFGLNNPNAAPNADADGTAADFFPLKC